MKSVSAALLVRTQRAFVGSILEHQHDIAQLLALAYGPDHLAAILARTEIEERRRSKPEPMTAGIEGRQTRTPTL